MKLKYCFYNYENFQIYYYLFSQRLSGNPDDHVLGLKHKVGDLDLIPENLQKEIYDFAKIDFWPAVLEYTLEISQVPELFIRRRGRRCLGSAMTAMTRQLGYDLSQAVVGAALIHIYIYIYSNVDSYT